jgi:hypothetical protein
MKEEFIRTVLKSIKKNVAKNGCRPIPRGKNIDFMRKYFLNDNDLKEIILDLSPKQCISGPEADNNGYDGHIIKFKSNYLDDTLIYIKLRYNPPDELVVISFHEDE